MDCLSCQHPNREGRRFCARCGVALPVACPTCGFANDADDFYCGGCGGALTAAAIPGAPAAPPVDRRPVSVLFADLVGSTRMSLALDPEDMRDVIRVYQRTCGRVVGEFEGFVARYMGDGVMCFFGYPEAREDDAERAMRAGLEIVGAVARLSDTVGAEKGTSLNVRIGIASGEVVAGDLIGSGSSREWSVVGETPNLAARMQGLAQPDTVVIDPVTERLARRRFELQDLGPCEVKGSPRPINAWRVIRPRETDEVFDATFDDEREPLIGRGRELDSLRALWRDACEGRGAVAVLGGEAGIGKSRLAAEFHAEVHADARERLRFQCGQLHENSPLYPVEQRLLSATGVDRRSSPSENLERIDAFLMRFDIVSQLGRLVLARLLSVPVEASDDERNLGAQAWKRRTLDWLARDLLGALCARGPVLVVFEDLHWADPTTFELLERIIASVPSLPILLLCTARPGVFAQLPRSPAVRAIELHALHDDDASRLLEQLLEGSSCPPKLKREVLEQTDGVPLFLCELARVLREAGGDAHAVPDSLRSLLVARIDRLGEPLETAQVGAVIGRQFVYRLLAATARLGDGRLARDLGQLVGEGLLSHDDDGDAYSFSHVLLRDVTYKGLLRQRRRDLHARVAHALQRDFGAEIAAHPEILAHHLTEARDTERAVEQWEAAARRAVQASANVEAERHFRRSLSLLEELPAYPQRSQRELRLRTAMGGVLINNHGPGSETVMHSYERCRALCAELAETGSDADAETAFATLWGLWRSSESLRVAMDLVEQMRELGEREQRVDLLMQAHHSGWATQFNLGELDACLASIDAGEPLFDPHAHAHHADIYGGHDARVCAHGIGAVALCLRGDVVEAGARARRAYLQAERLGHPGSIAHALDFAATFDRMRDDPRAALGTGEALLECATRHEFADYAIRARGFVGWAKARLGDADAGLAELRASLVEQRRSGTSEDFPLFLEMLAEACAVAGRHDEGLAALEEAADDAVRNEAGFWLSAVHCRRGLLLLDGGQRDAAADALGHGLGIATAQGADLLVLRNAVELARLGVSEGHGALLAVLDRVGTKAPLAEVSEARAVVASAA